MFCVMQVRTMYLYMVRKKKARLGVVCSKKIYQLYCSFKRVMVFSLWVTGFTIDLAWFQYDGSHCSLKKSHPRWMLVNVWDDQKSGCKGLEAIWFDHVSPGLQVLQPPSDLSFASKASTWLMLWILGIWGSDHLDARPTSVVFFLVPGGWFAAHVHLSLIWSKTCGLHLGIWRED